MSSLQVITEVFNILAFAFFLFNCNRSFSLDTFLFLGRLIWKTDKTFFTIFHLPNLFSELSYRFDPAFWFTSAGTECFGSSPITGITLSASYLLLPLVVDLIIADQFDIVNSFFQHFKKFMYSFADR